MSRAGGVGQRTEDVLESARCGTAAEVEEAIHLGADIAGSDAQGMTPLHFAASRGNLTTVDVLLKYQAPLDVQDNAGMSPLHAAVIHDREKVATRLISAGCAVDVADLRGYTPLHLAASTGQLALVRLLVEVGGCSLVAKTRLQLTPMLCAVEKKKCETMRYLADAQQPIFVLPAEPSDFEASCPPPSPTLARFLKTVPPRPAQAIQTDVEVRIALGPRPAPKALEEDNTSNIETVRIQRAAAVKKLEADRAAAEAAAAVAASPQRSEMWVNRRQGAAVLSAAARRRVMRGGYIQEGGTWDKARLLRTAAVVITATARRRQQQQHGMCRAASRTLSSAVKGAGEYRRMGALRQAAATVAAAMRRTHATAALEQRKYVARVMSAHVVVAALQRSVRRAAFAAMLCRARACRAVVAPRISAAVAQRRLAGKVVAEQLLAARTRRAMQQRSEAHAVLCRHLCALRTLNAAGQRLAAQLLVQRKCAAASQLERACLAAGTSAKWARQLAAARRLQAGVRWRVESDKASLLMGEAAVARVSLLERRRKHQQRQPSWKRSGLPAGEVQAPAAPNAHQVLLIWLPCFAADHLGDEARAGRGGSGGSSRATARSSRGTRQGLLRSGPDGPSQPGGGGGEHGEEVQFEEELKLCMGHSVTIARPLSSHVRRNAPRVGSDATRPQTGVGEGVGGNARPMTSGGSRNADAHAGSEEIVKRWAAAASSLALIEDDDLACAAVSNIIHNQGEWVSEGMKCWLAHCIARRSARRESQHAGEEKPWSRDSPVSRVAVGDQQREALQRAVAQLWPFIDEEPSSSKRAGAQQQAGSADASDPDEAATSISARQRICSQLHVAYLSASMGDHSNALKLSTAARKALAPVAAFHQERGRGASGHEEERLPAWPSLLSCAWAGKSAAPARRHGAADSDEEDDEDEGLGGYVDCCPALVLAVAQSNCAASLLHMGAADQALQMALSARASFAAAGALTGRAASSGLAWEAQAQVHRGIEQVLRAAQLANGVQATAVDQNRTDVLELSHDSDDEVPVARAATAGTALFAKNSGHACPALEEDEFDAPLGGSGSKSASSPFAGSLSTPQRQARGFATQPLGRLGAFGVEAGGGGVLLGSARLSTSEVAAQVANLLDTGNATAGSAPPSSSSHRPAPPATRSGAVVASAAPAGTIAGGSRALPDGGGATSSMPLSDINGAGGRSRFGQNGATWRLTHGTRPISASRHKTMGFNPEVGRHAPLLDPSKLLAPSDSHQRDADDF